jgi:cell division protein FtsB
VGRIALVLVLFAILVLYVNPLVNFIDAYRDSKAETAQLAELKRENKRLRERAATLNEPDAAERGARKMGMVAAGEGSAIVKGLGD